MHWRRLLATTTINFSSIAVLFCFLQANHFEFYWLHFVICCRCASIDYFLKKYGPGDILLMDRFKQTWAKTILSTAKGHIRCERKWCRHFEGICACVRACMRARARVLVIPEVWEKTSQFLRCALTHRWRLTQHTSFVWLHGPIIWLMQSWPLHRGKHLQMKLEEQYTVRFNGNAQHWRTLPKFAEEAETKLLTLIK